MLGFTRKNKRLKQVVVLSIIAICVFGAGYFGGVVSAQTGTTTIEPSSFQEVASYIIFTDGSTVYARNGATGAIGYSGADASTVIQSAINALTNGGKIFIKAGTYTINSQINVNKTDITLFGEGRSTVIYSSADIIVFYTTADHIIFQNLLFKSGHDPEVQGTNRAIYGYGATDIKIVDCYITSDNNTAAWRIAFDFLSCKNVEISGCVGDGANNVFAGRSCSDFNIHDNMITSPTDNAMDFGGYNITIRDNRIYRSTFSGWTGHEASFNGISITANSYNIVIFGNIISQMDGHAIYIHENSYFIVVQKNLVGECGKMTGGEIGIYIKGTSSLHNKKIRVNDNIVYKSGRYGIVLEYVDYSECIGNVCVNNGQLDSTRGDGIRVDVATNTVVSGNVCYDDQATKTQTYGITAVGGSSSNIFVGNNVAGNLIGNMSISSGNIVSENIGFTTEKRGSATITAGTSVDVTHGLAGTPTIVTVTPRSIGYGAYAVTARNSTTFTITVSTSGTYTFDWYAEYKP